MNSSTQSPFERAKAEVLRLDRTIETERDHFRTVVKEHEANIESWKESFKESHQSIILDAENAFTLSTNTRDILVRMLQEKERRVIELTKKLDETKNNQATVKLASEKINHGLTKIALDKSKAELEEAKRRLEALQKDLNAAEKKNCNLRWECDGLKHIETRLKKLSDALGSANKRNDHVEGELELSKRGSAGLQQHLKAAEQRIVDLEADLKAAEGRASGAEDELKAFKSRFKQINDLTTTSPTSPEQQPIVAHPMPSAPAPDEQDDVEQREPEPQPDPSPALPQDLGAQLSKTVSDKESDLSHCQSVLDQVTDAKNWESNQYFLKAMDSLTLASRDAKVGPTNLGTMKEKLAKGTYTSAISFKAEFDSMIADTKRLNSPMNPVRIAAQKLSKIFDQAFSDQPVSGHGPQETARSTQDAHDRKRKSGPGALDVPEHEPAQKRRSLAPTGQSTNRFQSTIPNTMISPTPASTVSSLSKDATRGLDQINADHVQGQITISGRLDIDASLSAVAQLVSLEKSPSTFTGHWKSLVPDDYWLTAHALPTKVEQHIGGLKHTCSKDMIVLRLLPAAEVDKPEFNRLLEYFVQRQRFATVSHFGIDNVEDIYLIPASKAASYPRFLLTLDYDVLPRIRTDDVLFMVIVFGVAMDKQGNVRDVWDGRMKAVLQHGEDRLITMRGALMRNPLHVFRNEMMILSRAELFLRSFRSLPYSEDIASPELRVYGQDIMRLSYSAWGGSQRPSVGGVVLPEWIFVLGRVVTSGEGRGMVVVDMQQKQQPLWLIRFPRRVKLRSQPRTIALLARKFPESLSEWEQTLPAAMPGPRDKTCLRNLGLRLENCKFPE